MEATNMTSNPQDFFLLQNDVSNFMLNSCETIVDYLEWLFVPGNKKEKIQRPFTKIKHP